MDHLQVLKRCVTLSIQGAHGKFPAIFGMGTFIDSSPIKL